MNRSKVGSLKQPERRSADDGVVFVSAVSREPPLGGAPPLQPDEVLVNSDPVSASPDPIRSNPDPNFRAIKPKAPPHTEGLTSPQTAVPGAIARAVGALRGTAALSRLSGNAWDLAFVGILNLEWRSLKADLGKLSAADTNRLADAVVRHLRERGWLRADDSETARMAAYAVRLVIERYTADVPATPPPSPPTPSSDATPVSTPNSNAAPVPIPSSATAPVPIPSSATAPPSLPAMVDDDATIEQLRALMPPQNATRPERDRVALQAQRIVDRRVRYLMANEPAQVESFVSKLAKLKLPVARLPVSFRNGWSVVVAHGQVKGTVAELEPYVSPSVFGQRYRVGLHDMRTGARHLKPDPVDIIYTFSDETRTLSAAEDARILIQQHAFVTQPGWPKDGNPFDLATVRAYFQYLCDSPLPMSQVFAQWQQYLSVFYAHADSVDLQGPVGGMHLALFDADRLSKNMQGVVDDLLPATTGQRLLDCEFFAGLARDIFGHITKADGSRRFDTYWVSLDTHEAQLIVERGSGARAWALSNNDRVEVQGTTSHGLDEAVLAQVGQHILWGAPAVFSVNVDQDKADKAEHSLINVPRLGAYVYDGAKLSRLTKADRRAFFVYVWARAKLSDIRYSDFIGGWRR